MRTTALAALTVVACAAAGQLGCGTQAPRVEARSAAAARTPAGGAPARVRLGWVSWLDGETLYACDRRVDDAGNTIGIMGPCWKIGKDSVKRKVVSWVNAEAPDRSPADAGPWPADRCRLVVVGPRLVPPTRPARLLFETPSGSRVLDEWELPADSEADTYTLEVTVEPEGHRLAIVRITTDLGDGERIIRVVGAKLIDTPPCA